MNEEPGSGVHDGAQDGPPAPPPPAAPVEPAPAPPPPPAGPASRGLTWDTLGPTPGGPAPGGHTGWTPAPGSAPQGWGPASPSAQVDWAAPKSGSNGCLQACLVIGAILFVLAIVGLAALFIVGGRVAQQISEDPEGFLGGPCPFVTDFALSDAVGEDVTAMTLVGFADGTMGAVLDKRLLPAAEDCWVVGRNGFAARIAVQDGAGSTAFDQARTTATDGGFRGPDLRDIGDAAFCTETSAAGSAGLLVRFGDRVAYVSVVDQQGDEAQACNVSKVIARTLEP